MLRSLPHFAGITTSYNNYRCGTNTGCNHSIVPYIPSLWKHAYQNHHIILICSITRITQPPNAQNLIVYHQEPAICSPGWHCHCSPNCTMAAPEWAITRMASFGCFHSPGSHFPSLVTQTIVNHCCLFADLLSCTMTLQTWLTEPFMLMVSHNILFIIICSFHNYHF